MERLLPDGAALFFFMRILSRANAAEAGFTGDTEKVAVSGNLSSVPAA